MGKFVTREIQVLSDNKNEFDEKNSTGAMLFGVFLVICCVAGAVAILMQVLTL